MPASETLFICGFENGRYYKVKDSLIMFDRDLEDTCYDIKNIQDLEFYNSHNLFKNPRLYCKMAQKSLTAIEFSPDMQNFAVSSEDGTIFVANIEARKVFDVYKTFFGGVTDIKWSPDGKYLAASSQDDLISIYQFKGHLVARLQGHSSWVLLN